jgi:hypothetical protein
MMGGLAEIGSPRIRIQMRPQSIDNLLSRQTVVPSQRKKLHELG